MEAQSQKHRTILTGLAVVTGLFMIIAAPYLIQISLERVVASLVEVSKDRPAFSSGILLFSYLYPIWRAFIFVGGITLILIAPKIYQGEAWTYPVGQLAAAFPAMGGMFMFLPYISWVEGFPLPMVVSWVGLAYFWSAIFLRQVDKWEKWAHFFTLTFTGMLSTHAFTIGVGNMRMLLTRPDKPLYAGLEWSILSWVGPISWLCVILLVASLPLVAQKREIGWWMALVAAISILAVDAPAQFIRTATFDYLYGSLLSLGLAASLLFPRFRHALLSEDRTHAEPDQLPGISLDRQTPSEAGSG